MAEAADFEVKLSPRLNPLPDGGARRCFVGGIRRPRLYTKQSWSLVRSLVLQTGKRTIKDPGSRRTVLSWVRVITSDVKKDVEAMNAAPIKPSIATAILAGALATVLCVPAVTHGRPADPVPQNANDSEPDDGQRVHGYVRNVDLARAMRTSLRDELLAPWYPRAVDAEYGGFLSDFAYDWEPRPPQDKFIVTQGRHTWTTARAAEFFPDQQEAYLEMASHGFEFLRDHMWDETYGGFHSLVTREGNLKEEGGFTQGKTAYGNAFGIYGLAAYFDVSSDPEALALAQTAFRWLDDHAHDPEYGGYFQFMERDGTPLMDGRGDVPPKDQNSSIHLLEAFTELYDVWPDSVLRRRLEEMLVIIRDTIVTEPGYLQLFSERDWTPVTYRDAPEAVQREHIHRDHVSFGHDVETAYLMLEAAHALRIDPAPTLRVGKQMVDHALAHGWDDEVGGFFDGAYYFRPGEPPEIVLDGKAWWAQAEALNTMLLMADHYPEDPNRYYDRFLEMWDYIQEYLIDHEHGGWYPVGLDRRPDARTAAKGGIWKSAYHDGRALMNVVRALEQNDLVLGRLFQDGMVMQRDAQVPVSGWAAPGSVVGVTFNGRYFATTAGANGKWTTTLPAMPAGGPYVLEVVSGGERIRIRDILIGDVWIASGQSNMEWTVANSNDADAEIAAADDFEIRHFKVPHSWADAPEQTLAGGSWERADPGHVGDFTAVGYFFARELREHVDVPVGIINTSWGGSRIEPWMSAGTLGEVSVNAGGRENHTPTLLYNKMIYPLQEYPIKGAIWYQGESNAGSPEDAAAYRDLFADMITSWREQWGQGDFPFLWVQLANFMQEDEHPPVQSNWALLRESQSAALDLPATGEAVIIDIGEADDIHPRNKQDVGARLALAARKVAYGEDGIIHSGPVYRSHRIEDGRIVVEFDHVGSGLDVHGDALRGFAIAGEEGEFVWANARVEGDRVVVWSDRVDEPVAVRYAWSNNPADANLYNQEGLPAAPFRTDDRP